MYSYAIKRLLGALPTLLVLFTLSFFLMRAAPGGPFDAERSLPPEIEANLNARFHLDQPLYQQYFSYLEDVVTGRFWPSIQYSDFNVKELIANGFPISMQLGLAALLLALIVGCSIGALAALKQNSRTDYSVMALAMTGISVPSFVLAPLLVLVCAVWLGWLPAGGWNNGALANQVLPVIVLALPQIAWISRLTRGSMIDVLRSPFILTARAKGLPWFLILRRHALKPALLPVVSYLGPAAAGIVTGSIVVETIFQLPGIGRYFVQSAINRDYTLVMGVVLFYGTLIIIFNFLVDLLYAWLDPKVRKEYQS